MGFPVGGGAGMRAARFNVVTLLKRPVHAQCANGDDRAWFDRSRGALGASLRRRSEKAWSAASHAWGALSQRMHRSHDVTERQAHCHHSTIPRRRPFQTSPTVIHEISIRSRRLCMDDSTKMSTHSSGGGTVCLEVEGRRSLHRSGRYCGWCVVAGSLM